MLEIGLLGTGGMMPLPYRWLTSMMLRYNGQSVLVDCGEGTQIALREVGWSPKPIDIMCFTHFHGDHISGLPGMLLNMGNAEKKSPLTIIGPKGIGSVVNQLRVVARELPFDISFLEINEREATFTFDGFRIKAFKVNHNITCYGYTFEVDRKGKFDVERAKKENIPIKLWNMLQNGNTVEDNGRIFTPDMVLGPDRKGLKVTYVTDTRPTESIVDNARDADLFICEGMYGEADSEKKAREHKHMNFYEAATLARKANVKELWLTHFSPSLNNPRQYQGDVRKIFGNTKIPKDGRIIDLKFQEE